MTGSDVASIMSSMGRNDGFLEGNGIIILILFFLIFAGGGVWGNSATNAVTTAELQNGLYNQTTNQNLQDIKAQLSSNNTDMLTNVLQNRYDNSLQTQTISSQISTCCCENKTLALQNTTEITNAVHSEGEATRALITQNRMADLEKELQLAQIVASNQTQTQNILNSLGNYYPRAGVNPYYMYGYTSGTTIY